ncbi:MAG: hypothetical protein HN389_08700 [Clostridia bacterium]|nr:hypothetical protein [Clostridia bacterium]MBT7931811.1 hypothetical protein [Candidatus Woesearchaeota archaeon]
MSNTISLDEAINQIWQTIKLQESEPLKSTLPYFFLVGAGISMPEIKGASGIIEELKADVEELYSEKPDMVESIKKDAKKISDPMKLYSFWFEKAHPNRINRQQYLERIICQSKISSANLLLAQILISKKISTSVVTLNFDDKLHLALSLFGTHEVLM